MTTMSSFTMSGASTGNASLANNNIVPASSGGGGNNQHSGGAGNASMSPMSSLSSGVTTSNPSPSNMSPMGMSVGMSVVGPSPGACLQQRDNGYSCAVGLGRATPVGVGGAYEPLHLGYGARPSCSPTQPYHAALNQYNHHHHQGHHHHHHHHPAVGSSTAGECLPHSLHSLLAL